MRGVFLQFSIDEWDIWHRGRRRNTMHRVCDKSGSQDCLFNRCVDIAVRQENGISRTDRWLSLRVRRLAQNVDSILLISYHSLCFYLTGYYVYLTPARLQVAYRPAGEVASFG